MLRPLAAEQRRVRDVGQRDRARSTNPWSAGTTRTAGCTKSTVTIHGALAATRSWSGRSAGGCGHEELARADEPLAGLELAERLFDLDPHRSLLSGAQRGKHLVERTEGLPFEA